jgi:hypothetical protein
MADARVVLISSQAALLCSQLPQSARRGLLCVDAEENYLLVRGVMSKSIAGHLVRSLALALIIVGQAQWGTV